MKAQRLAAVTKRLASRIRSGPSGRSGPAAASPAAADRRNDPESAKFRNDPVTTRTSRVRVRRP